MSLDKILGFTGAYGKAKQAEEKTLQIEGDCTIANYDIKGNKKPPAYVKVEHYNNSIFVEEGAKSDKTPNVADFSEKKALILERIARDGILSKNDILAIGWKEEDKQKNIAAWNKELGLNITDYKVDHNNGVLTVKWGENDILRIDFSESTKQNALNEEPIEEVKTPKETPEQPDSKKIPKTHTVESGETLSAIAKNYGIPLSTLIKLNKGLKPDDISIGQVIKLQADESSESPKTTTSSEKQNNTIRTANNPPADNENTIQQYTVGQNDTSIAQIAKKLGVSSRALEKANPQLKKIEQENGTKIIIINKGDILNVPPKQPIVTLSYNDLKSSEKKFLNALAFKESSSDHTKISNPNKNQGYLGLYQLGEQALKDIGVYSGDSTKGINDWIGTFKQNRFGITSKSDFLANPEKQHKAFIAYCRQNWQNLLYEADEANINLESYIGKTVKSYRLPKKDEQSVKKDKNGYIVEEVVITKSGLLAGSHLMGVGNAIVFLTQSNPETIAKLKDGNDTHISEYMINYGGYDVPNLITDDY